MVAGVGLIAAGGISRVPSTPDFTRHLPGTASAAAIVRNTVGGAGIVVLPMVLMVLMVLMMPLATPDLASASDPVSFLGEILPLWLAVPCLPIALIGTLLINSMPCTRRASPLRRSVSGSRATGRSRSTRRSPWPSAASLMLAATGFMGPFITSLSLLAVAFSGLLYAALPKPAVTAKATPAEESAAMAI